MSNKHNHTDKDITVRGIIYMFMGMFVFGVCANYAGIALQMSFSGVESVYESVMMVMMSGLDIMSRFL